MDSGFVSGCNGFLLDPWEPQLKASLASLRFLLQLLDAAYFDMEPDGSNQLRLRVRPGGVLSGFLSFWGLFG